MPRPTSTRTPAQATAGSDPDWVTGPTERLCRKIASILQSGDLNMLRFAAADRAQVNPEVETEFVAFAGESVEDVEIARAISQSLPLHLRLFPGSPKVEVREANIALGLCHMASALSNKDLATMISVCATSDETPYISFGSTITEQPGPIKSRLRAFTGS
ncbi:hypothetical protein B0H10DRAFT_2197383 [Mycena sp. CBHHK59/15]|nr:hypothetical protein B0H10DRAFT_2197383 [Mycena sp. CBHHK59/15]